MKILHALGWYFPESLGGTEIYVEALAKRQLAGGHTVEVAAPRPGASRSTQSENDGIHVFRYPTPATPTRDEAQGRRPARGSEELRNHLGTSLPDVFHVHTFTTGLGVHELTRAGELGIKIVATSHLANVGFLCQRGTLMQWGERVCSGVMHETACAACELHHRGAPKAVAWSGAILGRMMGSLGPRLQGKIGTALAMSDLIAHNRQRQSQLLNVVDRLVLLNRATAEVAAKNGADPAKLAVNYLGVSHHCTQRKPSVRELPTRAPVRFGYLGRFRAIKGILDLTRAAASLSPEIPFTLEIRGPVEGREGESIRRSIEELVSTDSRIRIGPAVPRQRVPSVLTGYDALCVPSVAFEGGPTVVSEAHAVGTPVIGTRVGAMPELIDAGINGALVNPGDWRTLAATLTDVAARPADTIDRWREALPEVRTMDDVAREYEGLYEEILHERPAP